MNWAEIAIIATYGISLLIAANKHGNEKLKDGKPERHNFWTSLIAIVIMATLLWFAGLFH